MRSGVLGAGKVISENWLSHDLAGQSQLGRISSPAPFVRVGRTQHTGQLSPFYRRQIKGSRGKSLLGASRRPKSDPSVPLPGNPRERSRSSMYLTETNHRGFRPGPWKMPLSMGRWPPGHGKGSGEGQPGCGRQPGSRTKGMFGAED